MEKRKTKFLGIIVIFVSFLIASISSLYITNPSVLDTDPTTYIIVVMLMLFVFIAFSAKEELEFKYSRRNVAYGIIAFLAYLVVLSYARVSLSYAFMSYRIDALLFPLVLVSFIVLVFGTEGLVKLAPVVIYSVFASPLILLPLLNLNASFAGINANLVYGFLRLLGVSASQAGSVILSSTGSSLTISTTCVSIGTFVAFVMFMIPLAYLYDGKLHRKAYWMVSGVVLILLLNLLRMMLIASVWAYYGTGSALSLFHTFAGQILFYLVIIVMMLIVGKYGLGLGKTKKGAAPDLKSIHKVKDRRVYAIAALSLVIAALVFFFSYGYITSLRPPVMLFNSGQPSQIRVDQQISLSVYNSGAAVMALGSIPEGQIFSLKNNNSNANGSVYILANVSHGTIPTYDLASYSPVSTVRSYLLKNGITLTAQTVSSENDTFEVNYFSIPYNISGSWISVNYFVFERLQSGVVPNCSSAYGSFNIQDSVESIIYNLIRSQSYGDSGMMCDGYLIASSAR